MGKRQGEKGNGGRRSPNKNLQLYHSPTGGHTPVRQNAPEYVKNVLPHTVLRGQILHLKHHKFPRGDTPTPCGPGPQLLDQ